MSYVFLCSMGANLAPEQNFAKAREQLSRLGHTTYSRSAYTQPVAIDTDKQFLNALFLIETEHDAVALKAAFNQIEESLGRDRSDPLCSQKDRPMDIDILGELNAQDSASAWHEVPDYLQAMSTSLKRVAEQLEAIA